MLTEKDVHDLNNKLCGIQGFTDLILDDIATGHEDAEKTKLRLQKISTVCKEATMIIVKHRYTESSTQF
jgi:hypothetical protein